MAVVVERTDSEFIIRLPLSVDPLEIQRALDYFQFLDIVSRSQATQADIDELAKDVKVGWSQDVKRRLAAMEEFECLIFDV